MFAYFSMITILAPYLHGILTLIYDYKFYHCYNQNYGSIVSNWTIYYINLKLFNFEILHNQMH